MTEIHYYRYCNKGHGTTSTDSDITTREECGWPNCNEPNLPYLYEGMGYVSEVLGIFALADSEGGSLHWRIKEDGPHFYVSCSDFFAWATSDSESITLEDLSLLRECFKELHALGNCKEVYLDVLFVCRKRKERPMKLALNIMDKEIAALVADYPNHDEEYWKKWNAEHTITGEKK